MDAEATVEAYYDALRDGEPLAPFFAERESLVKVGVSERLVGYEAVAEGLREQTATTEDWSVESHALRTTERERHAWFSDEVSLAWTDAGSGECREFETRWSGTLEARGGEWRFVDMHVSAPHDR